jgi:hypothetical protein
LLVEDRVSSVFATLILERYRPALIQSFRIIEVSGAGNAVTKVNEFPRMGKWFQAIGVLDGDERANKRECVGSLTFLPGEVAPEIILQHSIRTDPNRVAESLHIDGASFELALSSVEGMEHHDWLEELAKRTGKKVEELARAGFDVWIDQGEHRKECEALVDTIDSLLVM